MAVVSVCVRVRYEMFQLTKIARKQHKDEVQGEGVKKKKVERKMQLFERWVDREKERK